MKTLCFLIPAHNEEKVISDTLQSLLKVAPPEDIYVVSDGSTDQTVQVARSYTPNILDLNPNVGKAEASNLAIAHFQLPQNYEYIMPMDADTRITSEFLSLCLPVLQNDTNKEIACVVGRVTGRSHNWLTTYRIWEYEIAQTIHKQAQNETDSIIVCPGCATIYRTGIFAESKIPQGTLAEDMDLTFLIHRKKFGKIYFQPKATVVTQDPNRLRDFIRQISRWYTGFWQCLAKHHIPWQGQALDLEVALLAMEGLFNGLLILGFLFLIPYALTNSPSLLIYPLVLDLGIFLLPTFLLTAVKNNLFHIFLYIPHFYLLRFVSSLIFLVSFIKVSTGLDRRMGWGKATRYEIS